MKNVADKFIPHIYIFKWELNIGTEDLSDSTRKEIRKEAVEFLEKCTSRLGNEIPVCVNPTMLHPTSHLWQVEAVLPFDGYLPLTKEELITSSTDKILLRSCQNILKKLVSNYRQRTATTAIIFHLEDALEFCYAETTKDFDVIDCSNLADRIGLLNVINASSSRLSNNPEAALITESITWRKLAYSVKQYVEESLCSPLNMIPTIYGLRLASHVELGNSTPVGLKIPTTNEFHRPVVLSWRKVPHFTNIQLCRSPVLKGCLKQLARKCFFFPHSTEDDEDHDRLLLYTAQTFHYVLNSMIQRIGGDGRWLKIDVPSVFNLNRKTLDAWRDSKTVLKMTACHFDTPLESAHLAMFKHMHSVLRRKIKNVLRLVLVPRSPFVLNSLLQPDHALNLLREEFTKPNVHFIDNFQLEVEKTAAGLIENVSVSFLLVPDHGLEKTHLGIVVDYASGFPLIVFQSFGFLHSETFQHPYPFRATPSGEMQMKFASCIESGDQYQLKVKMECSGKFEPSFVFAIFTNSFCF